MATTVGDKRIKKLLVYGFWYKPLYSNGNGRRICGMHCFKALRDVHAAKKLRDKSRIF